jgi:tetratricopeptide (TPR) repeat protein
MKKKNLNILILVLVTIISGTAYNCSSISENQDSSNQKAINITNVDSTESNDLADYHVITNELVKQGNYEEALERFIWYHEHGLECDSSISGVRVSFALSYWLKLGDAYPQAIDSLVKIRDRDTKRTLESGDSRLFKDVIAINDDLNENYKSLELFKEIEEKHPGSAAQCFPHIKRYLFTSGQYDIIQNYLVNPIEEYNEIKAGYERHMNVIGTRNESLSEKILSLFFGSGNDFVEDFFVERTVILIEYLIATGDKTSAETIQERALTVVNRVELRNII